VSKRAKRFTIALLVVAGIIGVAAAATNGAGAKDWWKGQSTVGQR
jgi:hypothetical protein